MVNILSINKNPYKVKLFVCQLMMKIRNISQFQSMEINFKSKQKRMKLNQSYQARFQRRFYWLSHFEPISGLECADQSAAVWKLFQANVKTDLGIELNDYRWHQVCVSCSDTTCQTVLDNKPVNNLDTDNLIEPLAGNYRKLVIGDFDFGGKVQDLEFGFGKTQQNLR